MGERVQPDSFDSRQPNFVEFYDIHRLGLEEPLGRKALRRAFRRALDLYNVEALENTEGQPGKHTRPDVAEEVAAARRRIEKRHERDRAKLIEHWRDERRRGAEGRRHA
jgi:uncharacterized protein YyaL (SSP411 family)